MLSKEESDTGERRERGRGEGGYQKGSAIVVFSFF
jgi:hypothetical protein